MNEGQVNETVILSEKERIAKLLTSAVMKAHTSNPLAIGLVFLGSRTRGTERPDSDVDIVPLIDTSRGSNPILELSEAVDNELEPQGLKRGSHFVPLTIQNITSAKNDPELRMFLGKKYWMFDRDSVVITSDPTLNEMIQELLALEEKEPALQRPGFTTPDGKRKSLQQLKAEGLIL